MWEARRVSSERLELNCLTIGLQGSRAPCSPGAEPVPKLSIPGPVLPPCPGSSLNPASHRISKCMRWCVQTASLPGALTGRWPGTKVLSDDFSHPRLFGALPPYKKAVGQCSFPRDVECASSITHPSTALPGMVREEKLCASSCWSWHLSSPMKLVHVSL